MDGVDEKKWFIYVVDHHEGPYSVNEIDEMLKGGSASGETYLWAEGMPDWQQMSFISAFDLLLRARTMPPPIAMLTSNSLKLETDRTMPTIPDPHAPPPPIEAGPMNPILGDSAAVPPIPPLPENKPEKTGGMTASQSISKIIQQGKDAIFDALTANSPKPEKKASSKKKPRTVVQLEDSPGGGRWAQPSPQRRWAETRGSAPSAPLRKPSLFRRIVSLLVLVAAGFWVYSDFLPFLKTKARALGAGQGVATTVMNRIASVVPFVDRFFTPFDRPDGVSREDYEELKVAARGNALTDGSKAAVAVAGAGTSAPVVYISSNVGDGTLFKIEVDGIADTLLNQVEFGKIMDLVVTNHIGKTLPLGLEGGKPIPRGRYLVTVNGAGLTKPLTKTVFLGGEDDTQYAQRLKEYHERLRAKAQGELMELRQFEITLESRYSLTSSRFDEIRHAKRRAEQRRRWDEFDSSWSKMARQLQDTFKKWRADIAAQAFFYASLYETTYQLGEALDSLHQLQQNYFRNRTSDRGLDVQLGEAGTNVDAVLTALKRRLDQAEKTPPTPNGMPRRETL